jgi:hypothetical protein
MATGHETAAQGPDLAITGSPRTVYSWSTQRCDSTDIPDAPARMFRDGSSVQLIAGNDVNRRFTGPDVDHLVQGCQPIMQSQFDALPSAYGDQQWISATWSTGTGTVYALVHDEYQGNTHPGECPTGVYKLCWYNAVTLAVSTDDGQTYRNVRNGLVATVPYLYVPDTGPVGMFDPTNIVQNPRDGYYYVIARLDLHDKTTAECLLRTRTLGNPASWRAWSGGTTFRTTFVDPYTDPSLDETNARAHVCSGISPKALGDLVPSSITYSTISRKWVLIGARAGGFSFSTSRDLVHWSPLTLFDRTTVPWTYRCGDASVSEYPSLIDPAGSSRNFGTVGRNALLFYTVLHPDGCALGPDRDLVDVPVRLSL